ncbi:MAG: HD domain-containing protein [Vicinamibacterales bacterium]
MRFLRALSFAAHKHRDQRRKDANASPYINHPIAVATVLAAEGGVTDEALLLAALLHDTVEDTDTTPEELVEHFGAEIADLVAEVTDDKALDKDVRRRLQVEHAAGASDKAKQLKIADKVCNIRDIAAGPPSDWSVERKREYLAWAESVVAGCRGINAALEGVCDEALATARAKLLSGL